jgi:hypothetical protein
MATLEKIRGMKYLLIGFVGIALLAFIVQGLFSGISFFQKDPNSIATVNGTTIKATDYQTLLERNLESMKAGRPEGSVTEIEENRVRNNVINSMIQQQLLDELTEKAGFAVGKEELTQLYLGDQVSPLLQQYFVDQNTGMYSPEIMRSFIELVERDNIDYDQSPELAYEQAQAKQLWPDLLNQVKQQQLSNKFSTLIASTVNLNELEKKALYENNKVKADFNYVLHTYSSMSDEGFDISDSELHALYNKKKSRYPQEEARVLDFIRVNVVPSVRDLEAGQANMEELKTQLETTDNVSALVNHNSPTLRYKEGYRSYNSLSAEEKRFMDSNPALGTVTDPIQNGYVLSMYKFEDEKTSPDSITFNLLPVSSMTDDPSKLLADSLVREIKATSFSQVAIPYFGNGFDGNWGSHTEQSLLDFQNGVFDVQFKNDLFNAPVNEPVVIAMGLKGYYVVQVTEKTAPVKKYKIASIRKEIRASKETRNDMYNNLSRYITTNRDLQAFRDSASTAGYAVMQDVEVTKESINIGGTVDTRQIIQWAFQNKPGSITPKIYETKDYNYLMVAALREVLPEGNKSFDQMKEILRRELIDEKKAEKIAADYKAGRYGDLEQVAAAWGVSPSQVKAVSFGMETSIANIGQEPVIYASIDNAPVGQLSEPLKGKNGVYVLYVTEKKVDEAPYESEIFATQVERQSQQRLQQLMYNPKLLTENAKIENNAINFPRYE